VFPGAVLHVSHQGKTRIHHAVGYAAIRPRKIHMTTATIFDLASLTKPVATTTAVMRLVDRAALRLEDTVRQFIPEFSGGEKDRVTIRHLLNHSSGLRAWQPLYKQVFGSARTLPARLRLTEGKRRVLDRILRNRLVYTPGSKSIYSDLGFILLGEIVERVSDISLDRFCRDEIFAPLGMRKTFFPAVRPYRAAPYAATERMDWRRRIVLGEVHDNNAYVMGGVAGHAGLFSTAVDLARFGRGMLDARRGENPLLSQKTVETFISRQGTPGSSWALGWDTPSVPSSAGRYFSSHSFGHLGYTGTSLWIDPEQDLVVVLLTNRVHPSSRNIKIRRFRPLIHDLVYEEVIYDQA
jgi:CubicO group peptidase (beta-lactamase class C family)